MATGTIILPVQAAKLPSSNPAVIDGGQNRWYLLFDDTTSESCQWQFEMPQNYSSGLAGRLFVCCADAQTGGDQKTAKFDISIMAVAEDSGADLETDSFDTANTLTKTLDTDQIAGEARSLTGSLSTVDSVAAGQICIVKLGRNISDTAVGDIEVPVFQLTYTTS